MLNLSKSGKGATPRYLLITNTLHPYQVHNISVLSLPPGTTYRFRYESSYFLLQRQQISSLGGESGLLVLRDFERGTFIPLRTFRFFRVIDCAEFVFLELEFLSYVKYEAVKRLIEVREGDAADRLQEGARRLEAARAEREKYSERIVKVVESKAIVNRAGDHLPKLIIPAEPEQISTISFDDRRSQPVSVSHWARLVALLGGISSYQKACFYLIDSLRDLDSGETASTFKSRWRHGIELRAGRGYAMQIFQLMGNGKAPPAPGFEMQLDHLEKHVMPLRGSEIVDGAYDRMEFYFYVLPQAQRKSQSVLVVRCNQALPDPGGGQNSVAIPGSLIHVLVKWTKWDFIRRRLLPVPVLIIGVVLWFFADSIAASAGHGVKPQYVQLVALFVMAIAVENWGVFTGAFKSSAGTKA